MRDDWEADRHEVEEALEKTGAISTCEVCDEVTDTLDSGAQEEAIDDLEDMFGRERAEELVQQVMADTPEECRCAHNASKD